MIGRTTKTLSENETHRKPFPGHFMLGRCTAMPVGFGISHSDLESELLVIPVAMSSVHSNMIGESLNPHAYIKSPTIHCTTDFNHSNSIQGSSLIVQEYDNDPIGNSITKIVFNGTDELVEIENGVAYINRPIVPPVITHLEITPRTTINELEVGYAEATIAAENKVDRVVFYINNQAIQTLYVSPFKIQLPDLEIGTYTLKVIATDIKNRTGERTASFSIVLPSLPTVNITAPPQTLYNALELRNLEFEASVGLPVPQTEPARSIVNVAFFIDDILIDTDTEEPYSTTIPVLDLGTHEFRAIVSDSGGYTGEDTTGITIIEPALPAIDFYGHILSRDEFTTLEGRNLVFEAQCYPPIPASEYETQRTISNVDFEVLNTGISNTDTTPTVNNVYGFNIDPVPDFEAIAYTFKAIVTDNEGYTNEITKSVTFTQPQAPPVVFDSPSSDWSNNVYYTNLLTVRVITTPPSTAPLEDARSISSIELWVEGSPDGVTTGVTEIGFNQLLSSLAVGSHTLKARVTDSEGYVSTASRSITIAANQYSSAYNVLMGNISTVTGRKIANPNGAYNIGDWNNTSTTYPRLNPSANGVLSYDTISQCGLQSGDSFTITIYDVATPIVSVTTGAITGNCSLSLGDGNCISFLVTNWAQELDRFKARIQVIADLKLTTKSVGGRFGVSIVDNRSVTKSQMDIFYENETNLPTIGSVALGELSTIWKWVSGVKYATLNSLFRLMLDQINNLNDQTIPATNLVEQSCWLADTKQYLTLADLTNYSAIWNHVGAIHNQDVRINDLNYRGPEQTVFKVKARPTDVVTWRESSDYKILTYGKSGGHGTVSESFNDDGGRYTPTFTAYDSTASIVDTQDLQIINGRLQYPRNDYRNIYPNNLVDYNSLGYTSMRWIYLRFSSSTGPQETGVFTFVSNIVESNLNNTFKIFVRGNFRNVWLDLNQEALYGFGYVFAENDPCRVELPTYNLVGATKRLKYHLGMDAASDVIDVKIGISNTVLYLDSNLTIDFGA